MEKEIMEQGSILCRPCFPLRGAVLQGMGMAAQGLTHREGNGGWEAAKLPALPSSALSLFQPSPLHGRVATKTFCLRRSLREMHGFQSVQ